MKAVKLHFVITAGPTREHLDPVRFLSNPSTGKMGFALASAAARRGHRVTLVAGPVALKTPAGVTRVDVVSARDMLAAVERSLSPGCVVVSTAAVADWRPATCAAKKLKKGQMSPVLRLVRNPDILKTLHRAIEQSNKRAIEQSNNPNNRTIRLKTLHPAIEQSNNPNNRTIRLKTLHRTIEQSNNPNNRTIRLVGFAAETNDVLAEASRKCREKGLSFIVANDVTEKGCGFGTDTNRVTLVFPDGTQRKLPLMTKRAVARHIVETVERGETPC